MRILICDDDELFSNELNKFMNEFYKQIRVKCPEIVVFNSGEALLADTGEKDIVFLDVEMKGSDGIYVGNELKRKNENVIIFIVTAYPQYLDDAMRFHVFRYLSKPLDKQRLFRNLKEAIQIYNSSNEKIAIETKNEIYTINLSDIIFVEAQGRKITVHTVSSDFETVHNLKYWIEHLNGKGFYQTHKSYIVNLKYVNNFSHSLINLYNNKYQAYLTKRRYTEFKNTYLLYLGSIK